MPDVFARSSFVKEDVAAYAAAHTAPPDELQAELRSETKERTGDFSGMQIGDDQGALMEMIVRAMGVRRALEIGTFTGYSSLAIARGLAPGGRLICCDVSEEWTDVARRYWDRAGVADRVELRLGPAIDTLRRLPADPELDFVFLDADKPGYLDYYAEIVPRLRPGGLLLADNTLQRGRVADPARSDESTEAIRRFNDAVVADDRVRCVLLPFGDGVTFIQRR